MASNIDIKTPQNGDLREGGKVDHVNRDGLSIATGQKILQHEKLDGNVAPSQPQNGDLRDPHPTGRVEKV